MTTRFKARLLSAIGCAVCFAATTNAVVGGHHWFFVVWNFVWTVGAVTFTVLVWRGTSRRSSQ